METFSPVGVLLLTGASILGWVGTKAIFHLKESCDGIIIGIGSGVGRNNLGSFS